MSPKPGKAGMKGQLMLQEFKGTPAEVRLFCLGLNPETVLAVGVRPDGTQAHVVYRKDGEDRLPVNDVLQSGTRGMLDEKFGYVSHHAVAHNHAVMASMTGADSRLSGATLVFITNVVAEMGKRLRGRNPLRLQFVVPSDQKTRTNLHMNEFHAPVSTKDVYFVHGIHVVYAWNLPYSGNVFGTSPGKANRNAYTVHAFGGKRIMGMRVMESGGETRILAEFSDGTSGEFALVVMNGKLALGSSVNTTVMPTPPKRRTSSSRRKMVVGTSASAAG